MQKKSSSHKSHCCNLALKQTPREMFSWVSENIPHSAFWTLQTYNTCWLSWTNLAPGISSHVTIIIKAKELISKVKEVATKGYSSAWMKYMKEVRTATCWYLLTSCVSVTHLYIFSFHTLSWQLCPKQTGAEIQWQHGTGSPWLREGGGESYPGFWLQHLLTARFQSSHLHDWPHSTVESW